jgi:HEAT repeat protein
MTGAMARLAACTACGLLAAIAQAEPRSLDELVAALESGDNVARAQAALELRARPDHAGAAVPQLLGVIVNIMPVYREYDGLLWSEPSGTGLGPYAAIAALTKSGRPYRIVDGLAVHFNTKLDYTYGHRARLEVMIAFPEQADPVTFVTTSAAEEAGWTLAGIADDAIVDALIANLVEPADHGFFDQTYNLRRASARALEKIGDPRSVPPLITMMFEDREPTTRLYAVQALATIGDWRAIEPMIRALKTRVLPHRKFIARGLYELTGVDFGKKQKKWLAWWEVNGLCYRETGAACAASPQS